MKKDTRKFAIYSRKSKYTGKGESIGNQIELCKNYLKTKYNAEDENIIVYEDEGYTGANTNRPEFKKMLKDIKSKKIRTVICYRLDRISRNVLDFCNLKDELADYNVDFISIREDFDTSTPMGSAMLLITSVFAQLERDTIAERIRDNMHELAKTGRWLGGTTPLGFKSEEIEKLTVDGKKRKLFKLTPIKEERKKYILICDKFLELKSLTRLETYLIQNDIKSRKDNYFTRESLRTILKNPVYAVADKDTLEFFKERDSDIFQEEDFNGTHGIMAYNKTTQKSGKGKKNRNIEDWIIAVGKHKGFVSGSKWVSVQNIIYNNENKRYRKPAVNTSILSGVLYCGECGSFMRPKINSKVYEDGTRSFSYMCELKERSRCQKCNSKNIMGIELDKQVFEIISNLTNPNGQLYKELKSITKGEFKEDNLNKNEIELLEKAKNQNDKTISQLTSRLSIIDVDLIKEVTDEIKRLKETNSEIENKISELKSVANNQKQQTEYAKIVLDLFDTYFKSFEKYDLMTKRELVRLIIKSITYKNEEIVINLVGVGDDNCEEKILYPSCLHSKRDSDALSFA